MSIHVEGRSHGIQSVKSSSQENSFVFPFPFSFSFSFPGILNAYQLCKCSYVNGMIRHLLMLLLDTSCIAWLLSVKYQELV